MRSTLTSLLAVTAGCLQAATYHITIAGNDANTGLSVAQAFRTIQRGADVAQAGDSVIVHPGHYTGFAAMEHSGTPEQPIVFQGGAGVVIDVPCTYNDQDGINVENVGWVVVEGFEVADMPRAGIRSAVSEHVTVRSNTCTGNGRWGIFTGFAEQVIIEHNTCSGSIDEHGIYVSNSADGPIVRYNHLFHNHANGLHMNGDASQGGDGVISAAQVYGNIIHGNGTAGGSGINCDGVVNSVVHDNLLYDNHASGISLYVIDGGAPSTGNKVYNNTILNAADARWCVNITAGCTGNQVLNNILFNAHPWRGSITIASDAWAGFISDHNLMVNSCSPDDDQVISFAQWQALGQDEHSQLADAPSALFEDPANGDLHAAGPSAQQVDAGTSAVQSITAQDIEGRPRPQGAGYDIGCYEFEGSVGLPTALTGTDAPQARCWDGLLLVQGAVGSWVRVLDLDGRLLAEARMSGPSHSMQAPSLPCFLVTITAPKGRAHTLRVAGWPQ